MIPRWNLRTAFIIGAAFGVVFGVSTFLHDNHGGETTAYAAIEASTQVIICGVIGLVSAILHNRYNR